MTKSVSDVVKERIFVDARLSQARLVKEQATSVSGRFAQAPSTIQVRIETASGFSVALNNPTEPTELLIELDYKVDAKIQDTEKPVVSYESKHHVQFLIAEWGGVKNWTEVPNDVFSPYFAMVQSIAITRAENTLAAMGLRGVALPKQLKFDEHTVSQTEPQPAATPTVK